MNDPATGSMDAPESASPLPAEGASVVDGAEAVTQAAVPHAGVRYAVLRVALLVTVGGVLYVVGMRGWPLLFAAVLASGVLSFFVFVRQREAAARNLEVSLAARAERRHAHEGTDGGTIEGTEAVGPGRPAEPTDDASESAEPADRPSQPIVDAGTAPEAPGAPTAP